MDKEGTQRDGPSNKEIAVDAPGFIPERWQTYSMCQEEKEKDGSLALRIASI